MALRSLVFLTRDIIGVSLPRKYLGSYMKLSKNSVVQTNRAPLSPPYPPKSLSLPAALPMMACKDGPMPLTPASSEWHDAQRFLYRA